MRWRLTTVLVLAAFLGYALLILRPYLGSVLVRDAAVTSWSHVLAADIEGTVHFADIKIGERIDGGQVVATIQNEHLSRDSLDAAELQVAVAETRVESAEQSLAEIKLIDETRREFVAVYAKRFREQLDREITRYEGEMAVMERQLEIVSRIAGRRDELASRGVSAAAAADEANLRLAALEVEIAHKRAMIEDARERRAATAGGVFIDAAGSDPDWVRGDRLTLKLRKQDAWYELHSAKARLDAARLRVSRAEADFQRQRSAELTLPGDGTLWRRFIAEKRTVSRGEPILAWVDCDDLLVDMPAFDSEAALIAPGDPAEVIVDGEARPRAATVAFVRGSAATLGGSELAALAKGRSAGEAQVVLRLDNADGFAGCPIGRSAAVDIPGVGILAVLRSRLRF